VLLGYVPLTLFMAFIGDGLRIWCWPLRSRVEAGAPDSASSTSWCGCSSAFSRHAVKLVQLFLFYLRLAASPWLWGILTRHRVDFMG